MSARAVAAALAALAAPALAAAAEFTETVDVRARTIERREGPCVQAIEFVAGAAAIGLGYRRGTGCPDALDDELAGFAELLERALDRLGPIERPTSLFWRRIEQPEFQRRLAAAALEAGLGDAPDAPLQRRLPALLDERGAFAELVAIFAAQGYALRVASLEKLERAPAGGARPPYAALLWFQLAPLAR